MTDYADFCTFVLCVCWVSLNSMKLYVGGHTASRWASLWVGLFIRASRCQLVIVHWGGSKLLPMSMLIAYVSDQGIVQSSWAVILIAFGVRILMQLPEWPQVTMNVTKENNDNNNNDWPSVCVWAWENVMYRLKELHLGERGLDNTEHNHIIRSTVPCTYATSFHVPVISCTSLIG